MGGPRIIPPGFPCGVAEVTDAIAATGEINLQYRISSSGEGARLERRHAAGFVHFFREGMKINNAMADWFISRCEVETKQRPARALQKKSLDANRRVLHIS